MHASAFGNLKLTEISIRPGIFTLDNGYRVQIIDYAKDGGLTRFFAIEAPGEDTQLRCEFQIVPKHGGIFTEKNLFTGKDNGPYFPQEIPGGGYEVSLLKTNFGSIVLVFDNDGILSRTSFKWASKGVEFTAGVNGYSLDSLEGNKSLIRLSLASYRAGREGLVIVTNPKFDGSITRQIVFYTSASSSKIQMEVGYQFSSLSYWLSSESPKFLLNGNLNVNFTDVSEVSLIIGNSLVLQSQYELSFDSKGVLNGLIEHDPYGSIKKKWPISLLTNGESFGNPCVDPLI